MLYSHRMIRFFIYSSIIYLSLSFASITGIPILFSSPDAGVAYGATTYIRTSSNNYTLSAYGTTRQQSGFFGSFDTRHEGLRYTGSLGLSHSFDYFYGLGTTSHWANWEKYTSDQYGARMSVLWAASENLFLGPVLTTERQRITTTEPDKQLHSKTIPGSEGYYSTGLGLQGIYDTRDWSLSPQQGQYLQVQTTGHGKLTNTDYAFTRSILDFRQYTPITDTSLIAAQIYTMTIQGEGPFQMYPGLAGSILRGYSANRWIDRTSLTLQTEYRTVLNEDFTGALFWGAGQVSDTYANLSLATMQTAWGFGLRYWLNKAERICLRADIAFGKNDGGIYLILHEAF